MALTVHFSYYVCRAGYLQRYCTAFYPHYFSSMWNWTSQRNCYKPSSASKYLHSWFWWRTWKSDEKLLLSLLLLICARGCGEADEGFLNKSQNEIIHETINSNWYKIFNSLFLFGDTHMMLLVNAPLAHKQHSDFLGRATWPEMWSLGLKDGQLARKTRFMSSDSEIKKTWNCAASFLHWRSRVRYTSYTEPFAFSMK